MNANGTPRAFNVNHFGHFYDFIIVFAEWLDTLALINEVYSGTNSRVHHSELKYTSSHEVV